MGGSKTNTEDATQPDCPPGHARSPQDSSCVPEVHFHREPNISLYNAQIRCQENGWVMATAQELQAAWEKLEYNNFGFGMIAHGIAGYKIALPIQEGLTPSLKRSANIGIGIAVDGFYYVLAEAVTRKQEVVQLVEATIVGDTPQECLPGQVRNAAGKCIPDVRFFRWFDPAGFNLETAQIICLENGWALATAEEVETAWKNTKKPLDHLAYGMLNDGSFAVPVQKDNDAFQRGPNIGVEGGNEGFFYVLSSAASRTQAAPAQPLRWLESYEDGFRYVTPLRYVADGTGAGPGGRYHEYDSDFTNHHESNNWMIEMWVWEKPLTLSRNSILVSAAKAYLQKKQFPLNDGVLQQLAASVKADPVARYKFAPFLLRVCFEALVAENPTAAQQGYRSYFEHYQARVDHERAIATFQAWEEYQGRNPFLQKEYTQNTIADVSKIPPGIEGFMESDPFNYGVRGGEVVSLLYLPLLANIDGFLDDNPLGDDIIKLGEDMTSVVVAAGLGSAVGVSSVVLGTTYALKANYYVKYATLIESAGTEIAQLKKLGDIVSRTKISYAVTQQTNYLAKISKFLPKVFSKMAFGIAVTAVLMAVDIGLTIAEVVKKDLYEKKLRENASRAHFRISEFLDVPAKERENRRIALFTLVVKHLIAEPANSGRLTLSLPSIPEVHPPTALEALAAAVHTRDIKEVKFHGQNSMTLAQAQDLAKKNGWFLATEAEVQEAWTHHQLHVYAYGRMASGRFAVPVQRDHSNFLKGPNIGATGGNQGFFYTTAKPSAAAQAELDAMKAKEEAAAQAAADAQKKAANIMAVANARAAEYAFLHIEDNLHHKVIMARDNSDGHIQHQDASDKLNAGWQFIPTGDGYYYIIDGKDYQALVAGDTANNRIYHQAPRSRDNAKWKLEALDNGTFHITDKKHGKSLVAGTTYDGNVYHQQPQGRENAAWRLKVVGSEDGIIPAEINYAHLQIEDNLHHKVLIGRGNKEGHIQHQDAQDNPHARWQFVPAGEGYYYIIDVMHQKALVATDPASNNVYHQELPEGDHARWKLEALDNGTFHITDKKNGKSLVTGNVYDGNVYHQHPQGRQNATWRLKVVGAEKGSIPKEML